MTDCSSGQVGLAGGHLATGSSRLSYKQPQFLGCWELDLLCRQWGLSPGSSVTPLSHPRARHTHIACPLSGKKLSYWFLHPKKVAHSEVGHTPLSPTAAAQVTVFLCHFFPVLTHLRSQCTQIILFSAFFFLLSTVVFFLLMKLCYLNPCVFIL